jgi:hypothetical protein
LNKKIGEVGLTHEPCPLRQNHVIFHSDVGKPNITQYDISIPWVTIAKTKFLELENIASKILLHTYSVSTKTSFALQ